MVRGGRGHVVVFSLELAKVLKDSMAAVTRSKASGSESSRTEHEIDSSLEMELTAIARH